MAADSDQTSEASYTLNSTQAAPALGARIPLCLVDTTPSNVRGNQRAATREKI